MKNKLVVVTDLGSLKAYKLEKPEPGKSPRLELLEEIQLNGAHQKMTDQVSDMAGRFGKGGNGAGASAGERHNYDIEHRKRLIKQLTEKLGSLLRASGDDGCFLAASKEINHQILDGLEARLRSRIEKNLTADLTKLPKADLLDRFLAAA